MNLRSAALWTVAGLGLLAAAAHADPQVEWNPAWHRVRPWEYVAGPALVTGALIVRFAGPQPDTTWNSGILFDDAVRDAVAVRGDARHPIALTGDIAFFGAMGYRLVDSVILPGLIHGNHDVALQMSFIDLESFGIVGAVLWGTQVFVGRARPYQRTCGADPEFAARFSDCEPSNDWNRSFIAGHPAVGVTAAALTCLHHAHMPLYGGGAGDGLACGVTIAAATVNGMTRVLAEKHYASDLIFGVSLGLVAGYVVPKTLHYGWGSSSAAPPKEQGVGAILVPTVSPDGAGLVLFGRLP